MPIDLLDGRPLTAWVSADKHLPRWLRDFHDQKDVFKACEAELGRAENGRGGITWIDGHIYTIDRFLKFMALHGYALRKVRSDGCNLSDTIRRARSRETSVLKQMLAGSTGSAVPAVETSTAGEKV